MPGIQPTVEIAVRRWVMPEVREPLARREHVVEVQHRLAHAHEHAVVHRLDAPEVQRLVEDLRRASGCARSASGPSRRTCTSAGTPTARRRRSSAARRGSASAPPPSGRPSAVANSAFTVPSRACASSRSSRLENGTSRSSRSRSASRQVRHLLIATRRPSPPTPTPARARKRGLAASAGRGSLRAAERSISPLWLQPMRLAKYLAHAGVASRRAAETLIAAGRVSVDGEIVRDPARDVGEASRVEVDGRPLDGAGDAGRLCAAQARRRALHGARHPRAPDGGRAGGRRAAAPVSRRAPGRRLAAG